MKYIYILFFIFLNTSVNACVIDVWEKPMDYYDSTNHAAGGCSRPTGCLTIVTNVHISAAMMRLEKGKTGSIAGDLDYTLRAIPNHPQALDLASRLIFAQQQYNKPGLGRLSKSDVSCYFLQAIQVFPNQSMSYMVYAIHLHRNERYQDAIEQYLQAEQLGADSAEFYYNLGLAYVKVRDYNNANKYAKLAYKYNYPLPGLKILLVNAGEWRE
jgi:tetratricopeptide (TPR) repeat protein